MTTDYSIIQTVAPTAEPCTLEEVRRHLRVTVEDDDPLIEQLIGAAREQCEAYTRRQLMTATYAMRMSYLPSEIIIPTPPLQSVTSITYADSDGVTQTLSAGVYTVDSYNEPGKIVAGYQQTWPSARGHANDVVITFVAGYASAALVPKRAKQGMLMLIGHLYEQRESANVGNIVAELPMGTKALWGSLCWGNYA